MSAPLAGRIHPASIVTRVEWAPGAVLVYVRHADGRSRFAVEARAAIVAVPFGVLMADSGELGAIDFVPALRQKTPALAHLESASVVRVTLCEGRGRGRNRCARKDHSAHALFCR
jgi:hypothetical protein